MRTSISEKTLVTAKRTTELSADHDWAEVLSQDGGGAFASVLQKWLPSRRWFRSKARTIQSIRLREQIAVPMKSPKAFLLLFEVSFTEGESEMYVLPLAFAAGGAARQIVQDWPQLILAHVALNHRRQAGVLYDAIVSNEFCHALLVLTAQRQNVAGNAGNLEAEPTEVLRRLRKEKGLNMKPSVSKAEQSNSSVIFGGKVILKFFRRLDAGVNPELEIERFLAARHFPHSPALAGALEYHDSHGQTSTMAVLTSFVPGCHDAWEDTLSSLKEFYHRVSKIPLNMALVPLTSRTLGSFVAKGGSSQIPQGIIGAFLEDAKTLGERTAALHLALASGSTDPAFRPEPATTEGSRSLMESLQELTSRNFDLLRSRITTLDPDSQSLAQQVLSRESALRRRFQSMVDSPVHFNRIRTHGDYHLGQVLHHQSDFLIIDFEGEPAVSLEERRAKQSALRDVAGMIYSFFYAASAVLRDLPEKQIRMLNRANAARYWSVWVGASFLKAYRETAQAASFLPADELALKNVLDLELLRKAIYELGYELNNRPAWVNIAFNVLLDLLDPENPL